MGFGTLVLLNKRVFDACVVCEIGCLRLRVAETYWLIHECAISFAVLQEPTAIPTRTVPEDHLLALQPELASRRLTTMDDVFFRPELAFNFVP